MAAIGRASGEEQHNSSSGVNHRGHFVLYPNPNDGTFQIKELAKGTIAKIEVFDLQGKVIAFDQHDINESTKEIGILNAQSGIYIVKIWSVSGENQIIRVIKN